MFYDPQKKLSNTVNMPSMIYLEVRCFDTNSHTGSQNPVKVLQLIKPYSLKIHQKINLSFEIKFNFVSGTLFRHNQGITLFSTV